MDPKVALPTEGETLEFAGHRQRILVSAADSKGAFTLIEQLSGPGTGVPRHYHEREEETFHVVAGRVAFSLAGSASIADPGTTVLIPRGVVHGFSIPGPTPAKVLVLLTPAGAEQMFRELAALPSQPPDPAQFAAVCARFGCIFPSPDSD